MGGVGGWMNTNPFDHHTVSWISVCSVCSCPIQDHSCGWCLVSSAVSRLGATMSLTEIYIMEDKNCISFLALLHKVFSTAAVDGDCHTYIMSSMWGFPVELPGSCWPLFLASRVLALVPQATGSGIVVLQLLIVTEAASREELSDPFLQGRETLGTY